jgi:thiamine kinase-like enzyme
MTEKTYVVHQGFAHSVMRVEANDLLYFEKQFHTEAAYQREMHALEVLKAHDHPRANLISHDNRIMRFALEGSASRSPWSPTQAQQVGSYLGALHRKTLRPFPDGSDRSDESIQPNLIHKELVRKGYQATVVAFAHGDVTPGNCVFHGERFLYLIDFEESGLSDPLIDLSIALIECCLVDSTPEHARVLMQVFETAYFASLGSNQLQQLFEQPNVREPLLKESLNILKKWAIDHDVKELLHGYDQISI